jgi:hypothetical protein
VSGSGLRNGIGRVARSSCRERVGPVRQDRVSRSRRRRSHPRRLPRTRRCRRRGR